MSEPAGLEGEVERLRARLAGGELTPERVELAAWCGHEAARLTVGGVDPARRREGWRLIVEVAEGRALLAASILALGSHEVSAAAPEEVTRLRAALTVDLQALTAAPPGSEEEATRVVRLSKDLELLAVAEMALMGPDEAVARAWRSLVLRLPRGPAGPPGSLPLVEWALG